MDKKVITLETGWADMEAGIAKLIRFLEGDEGEVIGVEQYMHLYTYVRARGGRARASGAQGRGAKGRSERRVTSPRRVSGGRRRACPRRASVRLLARAGALLSYAGCVCASVRQGGLLGRVRPAAAAAGGRS